MTANPPAYTAPPESKSSKKKKGKADASSQPASTPTQPEAPVRRSSHDEAANGVEGAHENPYIRELNKWVLFN